MIDRRSLLWRGAATVALSMAAPLSAWAGRYAQAPKSETASLSQALRESPYVYISPLKGDGRESTCHGEVWFAWLDGAVVVTVATDRWKSRAVDQGLHHARVWVGDEGRWKGLLGKNEDFRKAPHFDARAEKRKDPELLERLLVEYKRKYPSEIGRWSDRMRKGQEDGSRVLIRYVPTSVVEVEAKKG